MENMYKQSKCKCYFNFIKNSGANLQLCIQKIVLIEIFHSFCNEGKLFVAASQSNFEQLSHFQWTIQDVSFYFAYFANAFRIDPVWPWVFAVHIYVSAEYLLNEV